MTRSATPDSDSQASRHPGNHENLIWQTSYNYRAEGGNVGIFFFFFVVLVHLLIPDMLSKKSTEKQVLNELRYLENKKR